MALATQQQDTTAGQESSTPAVAASANTAEANAVGAAAFSGTGSISASTATRENSDSGTTSINTSPVNLSSARGRPPRHLASGTTYYSSSHPSHTSYQSPGYQSSHQHRSPHSQDVLSLQHQQQSPQLGQQQQQQSQPQPPLQPIVHAQSPGQAHPQDQSGHSTQQYLYFPSPYPQPFGMPAHTSSAPSIPVASYTYTHHVYPHVPDPFTYGHGVGVGVGGHPPSYSEHDTTQQQQTQIARHPHQQHQQHQHQHQQHQPHQPQHPQMQVYGGVPVTTAGPYGYSLSAYAPTGTAVFTPQFSSGPTYPPYIPPHPPQYAQPTQQPHAHGHPPSQGQPFSHSPHSHSHSQPSQTQQQQPPQQQQPQSQYGQRPSLSLQSQAPSSYNAPSSAHYQSPTQQRGYSPVITNPSPGLPSGSFSGHLNMAGLSGPGGGSSAFGLGSLHMHMGTQVSGPPGPSGPSGGFSNTQGSAHVVPRAASGGNSGPGPPSGSHLHVQYGPGVNNGYGGGGGMSDGYAGSAKSLLSPVSGSVSGAANSTTPGSGSGSSGLPNGRRGHNTGPGSGINSQAYSPAPYGVSSSGLPSGRSDSGVRSRTPGGHSFATSTSAADSGRDTGNDNGANRQTGTGTNQAGDRDKDSASGSNKNEKTDWVMWVGNVPSDATTDELYAFFGRAIGAGADGSGIGDNGEQDGQDGEGASASARASVSGHGHGREGTSTSASAAGETSPKVDPASGVAFIFLISRSNCAFVNYTSEQALLGAVDYFNGRPLRSPEVDSRCPKLVCRVRKKGDDVKAGVGGQRGNGLHAKWVKQQVKKNPAKDVRDRRQDAGQGITYRDREGGRGRDGERDVDGVLDGIDGVDGVDGHGGHDGSPERPPLVRGGPAANNPKKSSSGSSVSFASTTSSLLTKHYPVRYFILKSLTKYDLDLSVKQGLWATQLHNEPTLDQAYRTSQTVYLIFGVNKSGEFFGYAKMDGPIHEGGKNPHVEWASRDTPPAVRQSPATTRISPQPPIPEEKETDGKDDGELRGGSRAGESAGQVIYTRPIELPESQRPSDGATTARPPTEAGNRELHRISTVDSAIAEPARHSVADEFPSRREEEKPAPIHQSSEPTRKQLQRQLAPHSLPAARDDVARPTAISATSNPSLAHLLLTGPFQDSPDPLTPGEDRELHSLDTQAPPAPHAEDFASDKGFQSAIEGSEKMVQRNNRASVASAPAALGKRPTQLSAMTAVTPAETWDGHAKARTLLSTASIEEELDGQAFSDPGSQNQDVQLAQVSPGAPYAIEGASHIDPISVELPSPAAEAYHRREEAGFPSDQSTFEDTMSRLAPGSTAPTSQPSNPSNPSVPAQSTKPSQPNQEPQELQGQAEGEEPSVKGGREEGWGSSFKIKWIRTDSLAFTRTRNLRNPWNHDREVKVSRDGTEVEPSIGQRLIEEWDKPEPANTQETGGRSGQHPRTPRTPLSPVGPTSPTHSFAGRHRGRNRAPPGWVHREPGQ